MDSRKARNFVALDQSSQQAFAALGEEIAKHPELLEKCKAVNTCSEVIAVAAAEVQIILDGWYTPEAMTRVVERITEKLKKRREPIVLLSDYIDRKKGV